MEALYFGIGFLIAGFFGLLLILFWLFQVGFITKQWVNDKETTMYIFHKLDDAFDLDEGISLYMLASLLYIIGCFVIIFIWPLVVIAIPIVVVLYSLRGFVRFKKKVNKALDLKTTEKEDQKGRQDSK